MHTSKILISQKDYDIAVMKVIKRSLNKIETDKEVIKIMQHMSVILFDGLRQELFKTE